MNSFEWFARCYDIHNGADYDGYAEFIKKIFSESKILVSQILDAGCGTGEMSLRLARSGYEVIAADISADMLSVFREKIKDEDILLICQDIRSLDLYGTVQAAVCLFDTLNYLATFADLTNTFISIRKFLEKDGLFIFDMNTAYAYEHYYGRNTFVTEENGDTLIWSNHYVPSKHTCTFNLTFFKNENDGYSKHTAVHTQRFFSTAQIKKAILKSGFEIQSFIPGLGEMSKNKNIYICKAVDLELGDKFGN